MDFSKLTAAMDNAIKGCKEPETVKLLSEAKTELANAQKEAEKIEAENKGLNDANGKLLETLKQRILTDGGTNTPPADQPRQPKSFETLLAEAAKKYAETQKGK